MITTEELEQAIRRGRPQALMAEEYVQPSPASYLRQLLRDRGLNTREAIRRCNLDRSYGYQLFNGTRVPSRCLTILMALELRFTEEETQRLLKLAGRPVLYARCRWDAAVLYALNHGMGPEETDALLRSLGEAGLDDK